MLKRKMITAALVASGMFISLEYTSVAQQSPPATQQNQSTLSPLDRQFITEAAQGGIAEVTLGQLATERATSDAVRQYAQRMIQEHTRANQELTRLASQKGVTPPNDMGPKYQAAMDRLSQIPKASFDQAYMSEAGINAHLESQAVYQRQIQLGQDPDLKAFAAEILPTVQEHLQIACSMVSTTAGENQNRLNP